MTKEQQKELMDAVRRLRLIDDAFFNTCMKDNLSGMEYILRIIMNRPQLVVREMHTQEDVPNIYGRSVCFDVFAVDADGTEYNIEVQRKDDGADPRRARFHASLLDTMNVEKGKAWWQLPPTVVIFITESDVLGGGEPLYHVERTIRELKSKRFGDASEILYVNATIQDDTPLGRLMHDFFCEEASEMHSPVLAERVRFFKSDEHGVMTMCRVIEDLTRELYGADLTKALAEQTVRTIRNQLKRRVAYEDIASDNETTVEEVIRIAKESGLAY